MMDYAGVAALIGVVSHILFTLYRHIKRTAKESASAETMFMEALTSSAAQSIEIAQLMTTTLSERVTRLEADNLALRQQIVQLNETIAALQRDNTVLRGRLAEVEKLNGATE
jgi:small-conductance mechanosensitive channel